MPGNPLSTFTVNEEQAGRPYDEQAPSGERWGVIQTTAAPKAVFDADSDPSALIGKVSRGHINVTQAAVKSDTGEPLYPNVLSPDGISRGWDVTYKGKAPADSNNQGNEINYSILIPTDHTWDYFRIWQPSNYKSRRYGAFKVTDLASVSNWQVGDDVDSSYGGSGVIYEINSTDDPDFVLVYVDDLTGGLPTQSFSSGATVTNLRNSETVTSQGGTFKGQNSKFHIRWIDDSEFNGGGNRGYSNAAMSMEVDCTSLSGDDTSGDGKTSFKLSTSANGNSSSGTRNNELGEIPPFYDVDDNGSWINVVIEFKRSSGEGVADGLFRMWKKTERPGGLYPEWTLIFEDTGVYVWSPYQDNNFTDGYIFGNKNGAYVEDTTFLLNRWEYWTQKPTFLIEAGV